MSTLHETSCRTLVPIALTITVMCGLLLGDRPAAGQPANLDAAVRQLQRAVSHQRDGSHLRRLFALRRLGDPSLRPLFYELVQHGEWQVQVHAVLGLAEIADDRRIDPWLITQLKPAGQDAAIASALDLGLMTPAEMRELLRWDGLLPMSRLLLAAELAVHHDEQTPDVLQSLSDNPDLRIAGLSSAILLAKGDAAIFSRYRDRLNSLPASEFNRVVGWLADVTRQYELVELGPWLVEQLQSDRLDDRTEYQVLFAALDLDAPGALDVLRDQLREDLRISERVRIGLMLLTTKPTEPAWAFDLLANESVLCTALANVGRARARGDAADEIQAIKALINLDHGRSIEWAIEYAVNRMPDADAIEILSYIIDRFGAGERVPASAVLAAVTELYQKSPLHIIERLETFGDDSPYQEALLLGLLDAHDAQAAEAAGRLRRIGAGRADSLALLLIASEAEALPPIDMDRLGVIAAGGGRVAEGLQTQAAWLYLKLHDRLETALSRIFE